MENLLQLIANTFGAQHGNNKHKKFTIGSTGCSIHFSTSPQTVHSRMTPAGENMYFASTTQSLATYGFISLHSNNLANDLKAAQSVLAKFMYNLHPTFNIKHTTGSDTIAKRTGRNQIIEITDYWQDSTQTDWKVKGLTNGNVLALLYVINITDVSANRVDAFLDSFCFSTK